MIIVTGTITARRGELERLKEIGLAHVHRSRAERGCISHGVAIDAEDENRLVFFERWSDIGALREHFAQEKSREFVREAAKLAGAPSALNIYEAAETKIG